MGCESFPRAPRLPPWVPLCNPCTFPGVNMAIVLPQAIPVISASVISHFPYVLSRASREFLYTQPRLFHRGFHGGLLLTCSCYRCSFCYLYARRLHSTC